VRRLTIGCAPDASGELVPVWPFNSRVPAVPWQPAELVAKLAKSEPDELVSAAGGYILLVRLNDFSRELAIGLEQANPPDSDRAEKTTLGFSVSSEEPTKMDLVADLRASLSRASLASGASAPRAFPNELLLASCYMVLLAERAARAKKNTISLGRGSSNDIVLRHPSISRTHAYLQLGPSPIISDPGSVNHVFVNGDKVDQTQRIADGDVIKLGAVQCVFCSPASLWSALRQRTSASPPRP